MSIKQTIENQEELRTALEKNCEQRQRIKQLETIQASTVGGPASAGTAELLELQTRVCLLRF